MDLNYGFGYILVHFMQGGGYGSNSILLQVGAQFCWHHLLSGLSFFFHRVFLLFFLSKLGSYNFVSLVLGSLFYTTDLSVSRAMWSWLYLTWILRFYKITIIFNLTLLPLNLTLHPLVQSWLPLCLSKGEWRITWECIHTDRGTISVFLWRYFGRNLSLPTVGGRILGWPLVSHSLANVLFLHVGRACDWLPVSKMQQRWSSSRYD